MQLSNLKHLTIGKNVYCDENAIIMFLPSKERKVWESVYKIPFLFSNCKGIVIPNKIFKLYKKTFNGRIHYLDAKKNFLEMKHVLKKIPVYASTTPLENKEQEQKKSKQFYLYDMTMTLNSINYFSDKLPEKKLFQLLIDELRNTYTKLKSDFPDRKVLVICDIFSTNDLLYLFLKNFRQLKSVLTESLNGNKFFDQFFFASINGRLIPTLEYNEQGQLIPIIQMIERLDEFLESDELADEIDGAPAIEDKSKVDDTDKMLPNKSLATKIVDTLVDPIKTAIKNSQAKGVVEKPISTKPLEIKTTTSKDDDKISIELDSKTLSKVMRYYKVTNPDIIANVKGAIDVYIKENGKPPAKTTAEELVLKAVNKSIYGTDQIDPLHLANPNLLFDKLKEVNVFSVPLEIPENKNEYPFNVTDVVTLKYTTGQHRQRYEFTDSIHENIQKVFKVLEKQQPNPIKVLGITWEYKDNDINRYTEYTVKLQNLTGNHAKYEIKLNVPTVINDKYFKIGGNRYIFSNQQHFRLLTKTKKDAVRVLTNYSTVELQVVNLKFNVADINDILRYIQQRYPNLLVEADENKAVFSNGDTIYLTGDKVLKTVDSDVYIDKETNKLVDKGHEDTPFSKNRCEFLYDFILAKIHEVNGDDKLTKTKRSIPYVAVYMSGIRIPFIYYMWFEKGLLTTLNQFGIDYLVTEDRGETGSVVLEMTNKRFLVLRPEGIKERLIINGLLVSQIKYPIDNLDDPTEIEKHLSDTYGNRILFLISNLTTNMLDPISLELAEFEGYPTNLPGLISGPALDMLLNRKPDQLTDLSIYRSRMAEIILRIMYKQITRAYNSYAHKLNFGDTNAKLMIVPDFVINEFLGKNPPDQVVEKTAGSVLELTSSVNPLDEIMNSSKVIKTGPGGLANRDQFSPAHRNTHISHVGIMGAVSTPESANVGIITHHTLTPLILNKYGSYGTKNPDKIDPWHVLTATEALTPMLQEIHADRAILA